MNNCNHIYTERKGGRKCLFCGYFKPNKETSKKGCLTTKHLSIKTILRKKYKLK